MKNLSLWSMTKRFRWRISVTLGIVLVEALLTLLFPLFIGLAVNDLVDDNYGGVIALAGLGVAALVVGSSRRFYDTRTYASIYKTVAVEMVENEKKRGTNVSKITARSNLLTEFVEFMENSMPEIVAAVISVVGTLIILASIDIQVFLASLGLAVIAALIYIVTGRLNLRLNTGYNDELERQVEAIADGSKSGLAHHYSQLMNWNIRLSDLETWNFSLFFVGVIGLIAYTPLALVTGGIEAGFVISALMYVFDYVQGLMAMPLHVQQAIRLTEISRRLSQSSEAEVVEG